MANTTAAERVTQWEDSFFTEYVRSNRFKPYMGADENAIIQLKENLTKKQGDSIIINLVGALDASGEPNDGSTTLVGNEKALPNDGFKIEVKIARDATSVTVLEEQASPIDILNAGKVALKNLATRYLRNSIIRALHTINGVKYSSASEAQKDAWLLANNDRVLFGAAKSNNAANDHSASLSNVDITNDKLTGPVVSLARRMAQTATTANGDGIRPVTFGDDAESYVMFVPTYAFRDLKNWMVAEGKWDTQLERSKENPMYKAGTSIEWDGVMVREIPEMPVLANVGALAAGVGTEIDVAPCFLCGAQALGVAWAMRTKATFAKEDDYAIRKGVGFMEMRGIEKIQWGQGTAGAIDWATCTVYVAAEPDA